MPRVTCHSWEGQHRGFLLWPAAHGTSLVQKPAEPNCWDLPPIALEENALVTASWGGDRARECHSCAGNVGVLVREAEDF